VNRDSCELRKKEKIKMKVVINFLIFYKKREDKNPPLNIIIIN